MHFGALGCVWTLLEIFGFGIFGGMILAKFGCFLTLGANYYAEMRIQGLTISGANYSEAALINVTAK